MRPDAQEPLQVADESQAIRALRGVAELTAGPEASRQEEHQGHAESLEEAERPLA